MQVVESVRWADAVRQRIVRHMGIAKDADEEAKLRVMADEFIACEAAARLNQAALVPPPHTHRHRCFGVLAPNAPLRAAVTAVAVPAQTATTQAEPFSRGLRAAGAAPLGDAAPPVSQPVPEPPKRLAHYLWAVLIARIYEVFPLLCPICGGQMRIIAFITHSADIRQILDHIGGESAPPHIAPARGPLLWDESDAQAGEGSQIRPDWDWAAQPTPDHEVDHCVNW